MACDVTREEDLDALMRGTTERFGRLTTLVANAGGGGPKPLGMPMADFRRADELNVFSLFHLAQLAALEMERGPGARSWPSPPCRPRTATGVWRPMPRPRRRPAIWCATSPSIWAAAFGSISTVINNVGWGRRHDDPTAITQQDPVDAYRLSDNTSPLTGAVHPRDRGRTAC